MNQFLLRLDYNLLQQLKKVAKNDGRSVNGLINVLIKRHVSQEPKRA